MRSMLVGIVSFAFCLGSFSVVCVAQAALSPQEVIETSANKMVAKLQAEKANLEKDPEHIYKLISELVLPYFNFDLMSKRVLGKYWRRASPQQRQQFTDEFRTLLVRTYSNTLTDYAEVPIRYLPAREVDGGGRSDRVTVRSVLEQPGVAPLKINYRLALVSEKWKIYDVTVDGVSLVTNYRSTFVKEIKQGGLDRLIGKLADRNKQLTKQ